MNSEDGQVYSVCILYFLVLLSTTLCSLNINKQIVNIADENLTDYSILSRYHYTKSKNYLKRRYRIRHWIPMFIGTPYTWIYLVFSISHVYWDTLYLNLFRIQYIYRIKRLLPFYKLKVFRSGLALCESTVSTSKYNYFSY